MGKKPLSYKQALANANTVRTLTKLRHLPASGLNILRSDMNVEVFKNGQSIIDNYFPVSFDYKENFADSRSGSDWYNINIFWEEGRVKDFNNLGLFGFYSTDYNKVELDTDEFQLIIHSDNGILIKISLS
ncbi:hypothetical protein ABD81_06500 [Bacillus thuringiensis]|uniref:hypothetical protein n=1 Tax=Bacillus thuringiensis TaxID=1428 RepID=UPI000A3B437D|nr:hypothetical protein [Bacillus thuringiensis]MBG9753353.1 hypothetical protein [Bacillus thuringiensis]MBG9777441.1 hypothetical protein [Bacillus thuringiensis]MBG9926691.1 hypothetical protein [Bacillus thuringiensis]OTZ87341.1 hypothetical protein BK771_11725 [Bacillus thuringiensis serovar ostriniae]